MWIDSAGLLADYSALALVTVGSFAGCSADSYRSRPFEPLGFESASEKISSIFEMRRQMPQTGVRLLRARVSKAYPN
jgi:hypothetical protein